MRLYVFDVFHKIPNQIVNVLDSSRGPYNVLHVGCSDNIFAKADAFRLWPSSLFIGSTVRMSFQ